MSDFLSEQSPLFKNEVAARAFIVAANLASIGAITTEALGDYAKVCLRNPGELDTYMKNLNPAQE